MTERPLIEEATGGHRHPMADTDGYDRKGLWGAILSGLRGKCPRCHRASVFDGFLAIAEQCPSCGLSFTGHDAGDGPAVAGIFILGFGIVGIAGVLEYLFSPPLWLHAILWIPLTIVGTLMVLRPLKGLTVALQYRYRSVDTPEQPGAT